MRDNVQDEFNFYRVYSDNFHNNDLSIFNAETIPLKTHPDKALSYPTRNHHFHSCPTLPLTPDAYCRGCLLLTLVKLGERRATTPELDLGMACENCKPCCDERIICDTALIVIIYVFFLLNRNRQELIFYIHWKAGEVQRPF